MKTFDLNEFKKHPERKLVLRHYRNDNPEVWAIEEAQVTIGSLLLIKSPQTGYDTPGYVLVDENCEVRDIDGNSVGTVEFMTEELTVEEFAERLFQLSDGVTIDFSFGGGKNEYCFRATKIKKIGAVLIIVASCDGKESFIFNETDKNNSSELYEKLQQDLKHRLKDCIYIDLCPKTEKELWGVTFDYEENGGKTTRRLAVTDCYDLFQSREEAEKWISGHPDGAYDSDFDAAFCSNPQAVLIDKWKE